MAARLNGWRHPQQTNATARWPVVLILDEATSSVDTRTEILVQRAMALLRRGDRSVTEVCFAVGCSSLGTFSTRFTELVGMPPSVYRDRAAHAVAGLPSCVEKKVTRPIRNREAPGTGLHLA